MELINSVLRCQAATSSWSSSSPKSTPCRLPRSGSSPRSTTPTSVRPTHSRPALGARDLLTIAPVCRLCRQAGSNLPRYPEGCVCRSSPCACQLSLTPLSVRSPPLDKWSPALQIRTVLLSVQALLSSPNPDDPLAVRPCSTPNRSIAIRPDD